MDYTLRSVEPNPVDTDPELSGVTVWEYLFNEAEKCIQDGDPVYTIDEETGNQYRYSDFRTMATNVASWFFANGMQKGDIVIYMNRKMRIFVALLTGIWRANGVPMSCYPSDLADAIAERILLTEAKWIYCEPAEVEKCKKACESVPWKVTLVVNGDVTGCVNADDLVTYTGPVPPILCTQSDVALILQTSGSTGKSKGAVRTHKATIACIQVWTIIGFPETGVGVFNATHISSILLPFGSLVAGMRLTVMNSTDPERILKAVQTYKPKFVFSFPGYLVQALASSSRSSYDLSSVEYVLTGGVMVTDATKQKLKCNDSCRTEVVYGSTETVVAVASMRATGRNKYKFQDLQEFQVGTLLPGASIRVVDTETKQPLGPNQKGILLVKAVDCMSEYFKDPVKTSDAFTEDGFYISGDLGSYDENGLITIYGRAKEIFKYFNNHVSPELIDMIIMEHPSVLQSCTVGVPHSDGFNVIPRTFVMLKHGEEADPAEIVALAHAKLPDYMYLRGGLYIVQDIPRAPSGKLARTNVSNFSQQLVDAALKSFIPEQ